MTDQHARALSALLAERLFPRATWQRGERVTHYHRDGSVTTRRRDGSRVVRVR